MPPKSPETLDLPPEPPEGGGIAQAALTEYLPLPGGPAEPEPASGSTRPWPVGARFGSIRVVRRLAVGGMGEVFEGFDESLRRRVALKALRRDRLSPESRARLLLEARVLSQLSDPRICHVYGWIEDPGGEFLVLELIEGETLDGYFGKGRPRAQALRLASELAEVLAASHRKGVIHRDLKPSNLMLTRGGKLKVLDFGISSVVLPDAGGEGIDGSGGASRLDLGLDDEALRSRAGVIVGTIHYMSPEQARGEKVTAASDLYSFGVVLEELLTGRPPHPEDAGVLEILVRLQKGERNPPAGLEPALADLILQLTAAAPEARPTAADVVHKLAAIRDAPRRRLRQALAAGLAALALAAGLWHTRRLTIERNLARAAEQRALASHREAEEIAAFLESMFVGADPVAADGRTITVREVLDRGADRIHRGLADQPAVRARLLATLGRVSTRLALFDQADAMLAEAVQLQEKVHGPDSLELADTLADFATLRREQDRHAEARDIVERSLEITRGLAGDDSPRVAERLLDLGNAEARLAHFEKAEERIRESLAIGEKAVAAGRQPAAATAAALQALANLMRNRGRYAEALELYQRGLTLEPAEQALHERGNLRYNTGITLSQLGRYEEAEKMLTEALALWTQVYGAEHANVAKVELALATIDRVKLDFAAAEKRYLSVLAIWTKVNGPNSTNVAFALNNLGNNYLEQRELARAEVKYREALAIFESRLGKSHPNVAMTLANLGRCLTSQKRHREAIPLLRRVVEIDQKGGDPENADLGWDRLFLAQALWSQDPAAARAEAQAALVILYKAVGRDHPELKRWLEENPQLAEP